MGTAYIFNQLDIDTRRRELGEKKKKQQIVMIYLQFEVVVFKTKVYTNKERKEWEGKHVDQQRNSSLYMAYHVLSDMEG